MPTEINNQNQGKPCPICGNFSVTNSGWSCTKCQEKMGPRAYNEALVNHFTKEAQIDSSVSQLLATLESAEVLKPKPDDLEIINNNQTVELLLAELNIKDKSNDNIYPSLFSY